MLRLMLADDEQYEREYLEKIIKENYPTLLEVVCKAADGVEFMEKLTECNPHVILLDIKMPRMDGLETAKKIREIYPDVHIVIVSAYSDFDYAKQAMQIGITEYLLKPYMDSELLGVLDRVIARIREREDALSMLSYSKDTKEMSSVLMKELSKDFLWNVFFRRKEMPEIRKAIGWENLPEKWIKVVLISCSALSSMGDFSQEVLKNYFHMEGVRVYNSIWMNQMAICLYGKDKEAFTELNSSIKRARNYLAQKHQIPVACGVSGAYFGLDCLAQAYEEAAAFIGEFSDQEMREEFAVMTEYMKRLCELEDQTVLSVVERDTEESLEHLEAIVDILEEGLIYEDVAVKLNFGRSLLSIIHKVNQRTDVKISKEEAAVHMEKLEQLNFNGDHLRNHLEFFSEMKLEKGEAS